MNTCVCCGREIPEGRHTCPTCEIQTLGGPDAILSDGTTVYFKTKYNEGYGSLQLAIYNSLTRKEN